MGIDFMYNFFSSFFPTILFFWEYILLMNVQNLENNYEEDIMEQSFKVDEVALMNIHGQGE